MMLRPGMNMMVMGRGGFPPHGHGPPMDDGMGYYGGGRPPFHGGPGPMGMRQFSHGRGPFEEGLASTKKSLEPFHDRENGRRNMRSEREEEEACKRE